MKRYIFIAQHKIYYYQINYSIYFVTGELFILIEIKEKKITIIKKTPNFLNFDFFSNIFCAVIRYRKMHPNIFLFYLKFDIETYFLI